MSDDTPGASTEQNTKNMPILNACLSLIKHLMKNKDKSYAQDAVCSKFSINVLKNSYKILYRHVNPEDELSYRGPQKASDRDKCVHCFNEIYKLLVKLDSQDKCPIIACPSDELNQVFPATGQNDFSYENRLRNVEIDMARLKSVEKSINDLRAEIRSFSRDDWPGPKPGVHVPRQLAQERLRLTSISSVKSATSVSSSKRLRSESDIETVGSEDDESQFEVPKYNQKKAKNREKKLKSSPERPSYSSKLITGSGKPPLKSRPVVWGKSHVPNVQNSLSGAVPDLFMFNVVGEPSEETVGDYLSSCNISVKKVKLVSHANAPKRSFRISVSSFTDYDKMMSGEVLARGIGLRKFIPPKSEVTSSIWAPRKDANQPTTDSLSKTISKFMKESDAELQVLSNPAVIKLPSSDAPSPMVNSEAMDTGMPSSMSVSNKDTTK